MTLFPWPRSRTRFSRGDLTSSFLLRGPRMLCAQIKKARLQFVERRRFAVSGNGARASVACPPESGVNRQA